MSLIKVFLSGNTSRFPEIPEIVPFGSSEILLRCKTQKHKYQVKKENITKINFYNEVPQSSADTG
jgi:hypothetical protein